MTPELLAFLGVLVSGAFGVLQFRAGRRADAAEKRAGNLQQSFNAANERASKLDTTLNEKIETLTNSYEQFIDSLTADINRLQDEAKAIRADTEAARSTHRAQIAQFEETIKGYGVQLGDIHVENTELRQQVAEMKTLRQDLIGRLEMLQAENAALREKRNKLEQRIARQEKRIEALEAYRNDVKKKEEA